MTALRGVGMAGNVKDLMRSLVGGIEGVVGIIECAVFGRIQILSRPESGRGS